MSSSTQRSNLHALFGNNVGKNSKKRFLLRYSEAAQRASLIFRDQIETPLERAVFWVEHVLQHKGAPHLRLGSRELSWYQRKLIDVYSLLFLIVALPTFAILLCLQRYCFLKKSNERLKKKTD